MGRRGQDGCGPFPLSLSRFLPTGASPAMSPASLITVREKSYPRTATGVVPGSFRTSRSWRPETYNTSKAVQNNRIIHIKNSLFNIAFFVPPGEPFLWKNRVVSRLLLSFINKTRQPISGSHDAPVQLKKQGNTDLTQLREDVAR